jgi:hypothetical protein
MRQRHRGIRVGLSALHFDRSKPIAAPPLPASFAQGRVGRSLGLKDEERGLTMARQKRRTSLFRRLIYFVVLLISGGGAGGYAFQGHPLVQSLFSLVTGKSADGAASTLDGSLVTEVVDALKPRDALSQPGLYQVTVARIELDQKLFRPGHTLDIQARVRKLDSGGRDTTLWDSKAFGSRLAVVGKDELTAGWPNRPFEVQWNIGDQIVLEVIDARTGLFIQPRRFTMARADASAKEFPLKSGDFPLESAQNSDSPVNPRTNHVVLKTERLGELSSPAARTAEVDDRPVIIR